MIKRILVDNFKCLSNFEFQPSRVNLILGTNGSGKTALLDVVSRVAEVAIDGIELDKVFPEGSRTRWEQRTPQMVELDVQLGSSLYEYRLKVDQGQIQSESVTLENRTLFAYSEGQVQLHNNEGVAGPKFPFRGHRSFLAQIESRNETRDLVQFLDFLANTRYLRLDARRVLSSSEQEERFLTTDGRNFASWYRHLTQQFPERLDALRADLKKIIPGFQTLKLQSTGVGSVRQLSALLEASGSKYLVDFDELSDGQRALIMLYTLLHGMEPAGCLMLDEPEAHVGLSEVQPWLVLLDEAFQTSGQVFIISHHPEVIDYLAAGTAWLFERPDGAATRTPKHPRFDRESGLAASQQISRGLLHGV